MRPMLRILFWLGLGLSTILFVGTVVLWVRSLGYREGWSFERFEPRPDRTAPDLAGEGVRHEWLAHATHGRLWLGSWNDAVWSEFTPRTNYRRDPISADKAQEAFDLFFQPGERPIVGGTERAWRFAGAGLWRYRRAVDPRIGRPNLEDFTLAIPFWMLAIIFGLWPLCFTAWRLLRKKRHAPGLCPACGYDLRATPNPAGPLLPRCPECGREVVSSAA